jgi:hypothetical protein
MRSMQCDPQVIADLREPARQWRAELLSDSGIREDL